MAQDTATESQYSEIECVLCGEPCGDNPGPYGDICPSCEDHEIGRRMRGPGDQPLY